jgi:hypothetical protein
MESAPGTSPRWPASRPDVERSSWVALDNRHIPRDIAACCPLGGQILGSIANRFYLCGMTADAEADFALRVQSNQSRLSSALRREYDFVVCIVGIGGGAQVG